MSMQFFSKGTNEYDTVMRLYFPWLTEFGCVTSLDTQCCECRNSTDSNKHCGSTDPKEKIKRSMRRIFNDKVEQKESVIKLECPGVTKASLSITVTGNLVKIKDSTENYSDYTVEYNKDKHDLSTLKASYSDGILTLTVSYLSPISITVE